MIKKISFLFLVFCAAFSFADEGDTIVVQTIDFNTPVKPGWNAPREGFYVFPSDTIRFSKILMYHTLKCDPTQSPACGEWDYTTHNYLYHHTGTYDSNLFYHPNFIAGGASPDSFMYMDNVSWKYRAWLEYSNSTTPITSAAIGMPVTVSSLNQPQNSDNGRQQYLYRADELIAAGFAQGDITGIQLAVTVTGSVLRKFTVRLASSDQDTLYPGGFINDGLLKVFEKDFVFGNTGWTAIPFSVPFEWDGSSNIVIDVSYVGDENTLPIELDAAPSGFKAAISSHDNNHNLYFHEGDFIEVPVDGISMLDSAITISFWAYGNWKQPVNNSALEAFNEEGKRVVNIHLPWSNGNIYWDCGTDGAYDRIYKGVSPDTYKGSWNHWAFTKDITTQQMWIYLNGFPFHTGAGKNKPLDGITKFKIGSNGNGASNYEGMLDELRIFNTALDQATIKEWMNKDLDPSHPAFNNLLAYFQFNESSGYETVDNSSYAILAPLYGYPEWMDYKGKNRVMNYEQMNVRPIIIFESGNYDPMELDSIVRVDTLPHNQVMIVLFEDFNNPTQATDTLDKWPHYYNDFVFDEGGQATDSTLVDPDHIIYKIESPYYVPYEVLDAYELGRFITPYGNGLSLGEGFTWVYDVSDFKQFLHDTVHLTAGNFQELLDLKFYMIEGIPPRDVLNIEKMWHGYWALSNFEEKVLPKTVYLDPEADMFSLKVTTSGHEFDNATNCAEFCQKTHWIDVDSITRYEWEIIDECADNPLYPQGGTWIYDRAGWCPGARVTEQNREITPFIQSDSVTLDYNCDYDQYGRYSVSSYFVSYSAPNFTLDAAVDEVITPNIRKFYGRFNPMCGRPEIVIRNTGSDTLTSLSIDYGPQSGIMQTFQWEGQLAFLEKETVSLDPIDWTGWQNGNNNFTVTVSNPNGGSDEYAFNNTMKTQFELTPEYPNEIIIKLKTNKVAYQNYYEILDADGNVVFTRDDFENETTYEDTVYLDNGCYTFILHDSGDNGISFWANSQGSGYIFFKDFDGTILFYFDPDFGKFTQIDFTVGLAVNIAQPHKEEFFEVYPNPSTGLFNIAYSFEEADNIELIIYDYRGALIHSDNVSIAQKGIFVADLSGHPRGMYFCTLRNSAGIQVKKIIVAH
ncbi:MAG: T9SS type A sorting domain-containing protein [Bacteroidales bacterium]|nr:T9SS type A sorting domain-containing protein [Bacteroidales bacterium]